MNPMRRMCRVRRAGRESGYSLVELMVAMAISAFLLAGLFTIFQGTRHTSDQQTGLSELQDEQRLSMTMIADIVQISGAFADPTNGSPTGVFQADGNFQAGQALYGTTPAATGPDTLTVRYQSASGSGVLNCNGVANTTGAAVVYLNTYSIATNAAGVSQLLCAVQTGIPAAGALVAFPLVNNVTNMQFWYAVNTTNTIPSTAINSTGTSTPSPVLNAGCPGDTYIPTASMGANDWTNVCAVKVVLTFVNPLYQPAGQPKPTPGQPQTVQFTRVIGIQGKAGPALSSIQKPAGT